MASKPKAGKAAAGKAAAGKSRVRGKAARRYRGERAAFAASATPWLALTLFAGVVASGIQVALQAQEVRQIQRSLEETRHRQDRLLAEHSRLLLERGALSSYQNVQRVAQKELDMRFPAQVEPLLP